MYGRAIRFSINVKSTVNHRVVNYPSFFLSTQPNYKDRNLVDDIRDSASGMPPGASPSGVNVVKTSTTPSASPTSSDRSGDAGSYASPTSSAGRGGDTGSYASPTSSAGRGGDTGSYASPTSFDRSGDARSYVADSVKQGVVKAMETGIEIGEMAKKTLDNVWDTTKDTTHKVKDAVAGNEDEKYDVPPTDHFVDDLRKHAGGYDQRRRNN